MSAQSWLNKIWYQRAAPPWWLLPLSAIYGSVSAMRRRSFAEGRRAPARMARPVIVVGNLSVGGTGKTPLVCWLVAALKDKGFNPGVVTRGFGGSSRQARLIQASDDPAVVGDEPILLAHRTHATVAIGRDRPAAAQLLIDSGCDVVVSDDGLQHYALARDCEIAVIDGERIFGNGALLPAGPLRELPARLRSVDAVVVNGGSFGAAQPQIDNALRMRIEAGSAVSLTHGSAKPLTEFAGQTIHAVAAIGNPQRFFNMLQSFGIKVIAHPLPDHAHLRGEDIFFADDLLVFMTEKDAVKCLKMAGDQHWQVPIDVAFNSADSNALLDIVTKAIEKRAARS
jgi:tetraacyldisaccharide 4'-kinase